MKTRIWKANLDEESACRTCRHYRPGEADHCYLAGAMEEIAEDYATVSIQTCSLHEDEEDYHGD